MAAWFSARVGHTSAPSHVAANCTAERNAAGGAAFQKADGKAGDGSQFDEIAALCSYVGY